MEALYAPEWRRRWDALAGAKYLADCLTEPLPDGFVAHLRLPPVGTVVVACGRGDLPPADLRLRLFADRAELETTGVELLPLPDLPPNLAFDFAADACLKRLMGLPAASDRTDVAWQLRELRETVGEVAFHAVCALLDGGRAGTHRFKTPRQLETALAALRTEGWTPPDADLIRDALDLLSARRYEALPDWPDVRTRALFPEGEAAGLDWALTFVGATKGLLWAAGLCRSMAEAVCLPGGPRTGALQLTGTTPASDPDAKFAAAVIDLILDEQALAQVLPLLENGARVAVRAPADWLALSQASAFKTDLRTYFHTQILLEAPDGAHWYFCRYYARDPSEDEPIGPTAFVRVTKPLKELHAARQRDRLQGLLHTIAEAAAEAQPLAPGVRALQTPTLDIRLAALHSGTPDLPLRASEAWYALLNVKGVKPTPARALLRFRQGLAPPLPDFFCLEALREEGPLVFCRNGAGWEGWLEAACLAPFHPRGLLFCASELLPPYAQAYVAWGEGRRTRTGKLWPEASRFKPWWRLAPGPPPDFVLDQGGAFFNEAGAFFSDKFVIAYPQEPALRPLLAEVLTSAAQRALWAGVESWRAAELAHWPLLWPADGETFPQIDETLIVAAQAQPRRTPTPVEAAHPADDLLLREGLQLPLAALLKRFPTAKGPPLTFAPPLRMEVFMSRCRLTDAAGRLVLETADRALADYLLLAGRQRADVTVPAEARAVMASFYAKLKTATAVLWRAARPYSADKSEAALLTRRALLRLGLPEELALPL